MTDAVEDVAVRSAPIQLGQLLKLAGVADTGGSARTLIAGGAVAVNGEREERRGRKLAEGDVVAVGGRTLRVVVAPPDAG